MFRNVLSLVTAVKRNNYFVSTGTIMKANSGPANSLAQVDFSTFSNKIVTYQDVKKVSQGNNDVTIIDVREPEELKSTGVLPGSINIPLGTLGSVLKDETSEQFLAKYGKKKPIETSTIIFSCHAGRRSDAAQKMAEKLGFQRVHNYSGGWQDWEQNSKQ
ncbi:hypothetical protein JTB14_000445 [Gonioctena quinquepunctata]|nr:hypothetical protein JTB14_000445 [Gonioctena quinquepunctata]